MTENEKGFWFIAGYFAAIAVGMIADGLIRLMNDLLSDTDSTEVAVSLNGGAATSTDEDVAKESVALISEYTEERTSE